MEREHRGVYDGDGPLDAAAREVAELAVAQMTGGAYSVLAATDYFSRPLPQDRSPGWPATRIELSDYPTSGYYYFPAGYATVRAKIVTGWAAIPDDITDVAVTTAVRAWGARQSGQADIVGNDETGAPLVSRYVSGFHWAAIKAYRVKKPASVG